MSINMDIELRVETEEVAAAIRQYLYELEQTTVEQFLNGREEQNEGTDEDSECEGRRENGVGHGSTGDGGQRCVQVRNVTIEWIPARCTIGYWPLWDTETRPFRPERGEGRDDSPYAGWIAASAAWNPSEFTTYWNGMRVGDNHKNSEANERAEALLLEHLTEEQAEHWKDKRKFVVMLPNGNSYTIDGERDIVIRADGTKWCLQPEEYMPMADVCLARKLLLEADEAEFLERANNLSVYDGATLVFPGIASLLCQV